MANENAGKPGSSWADNFAQLVSSDNNIQTIIDWIDVHRVMDYEGIKRVPGFPGNAWTGDILDALRQMELRLDDVLRSFTTKFGTRKWRSPAGC